LRMILTGQQRRLETLKEKGKSWGRISSEMV